MSHYKCSNCGSLLGQGYGFCKDCTPKEYLDFMQEVDRRTKSNGCGCFLTEKLKYYERLMVTIGLYDKYKNAVEAYNRCLPLEEPEIALLSLEGLKANVLKIVESLRKDIDKLEEKVNES